MFTFSVGGCSIIRRQRALPLRKAHLQHSSWVLEAAYGHPVNISSIMHLPGFGLGQSLSGCLSNRYGAAYYGLI